MSDRFENILKRNIVGEVSTLKKKKRNRKLNRMTYRDNQDYCYDAGDDTNLKIIT